MKNQSLILIGGGGHCKSCIDVVEQNGFYTIAGIIDAKDKIGEKVLGYEIIGSDEDLPLFTKEYGNFLISLGHLGNPFRRKEIFNLIKSLHGNFPVIVSPLAYVSQHAVVNKGTIIMHQAVVNAGAVIGANCIVNTKALIEHDVVIEDDCHISTAAIVNGGVKVGKNTFLGSGAVCVQYTTIKPDSFIKANSIYF